MKRFTETDKWRDSWFQALSPDAKLVFIYMAESCDAAGVWDPNERLAEFSIGKKMKWSDIYAELKGKIQRMKSGKIFLLRFIDFQYGTLTEACKPHLKVLRVLQSHGIKYPIDTLSIGYLGTLEDIYKEEEEEEDKVGAGGKSDQAELLALPRFDKSKIPPTPEDVTAYSAEIGYPMDGQAWCDAYQQKEWKVGKHRMKDWQAAVRNWKANGYMPSRAQSNTGLENRFANAF